MELPNPPRPGEDPESFHQALTELIQCVTRYSSNKHINGEALVHRIRETADALGEYLVCEPMGKVLSPLAVECRELAESVFADYLEGKVIITRACDGIISNSYLDNG
jgi:hypothetical protein